MFEFLLPQEIWFYFPQEIGFYFPKKLGFTGIWGAEILGFGDLARKNGPSFLRFKGFPIWDSGKVFFVILGKCFFVIWGFCLLGFWESVCWDSWTVFFGIWGFCLFGFTKRRYWDLKKQFAGICGIELGQNLGIELGEILGIDKAVTVDRINMNKDGNIQVFLYILRFL